MPAGADVQLHAVARSGGGQQSVRIFLRHRGVVLAVHQQHGAAQLWQGGEGGDGVEAIADGALHILQDVGADDGIWQVLFGHPALHHVGGVGEGGQADDGGDLRPPGGRQKHRARADGMAEQGDAAWVDVGLGGQPVHRVHRVFGEARQRGEGLVIAGAVAAGVDEQQRKSGGMQRGGQWQHEVGIAAPAMHDDEGGRGPRRGLRCGQMPGMQGFAVGGGDAHRGRRQPEVGRAAGVRQPRGTQAAAQPPVEQRPQRRRGHPRQHRGQQGRDEFGARHGLRSVGAGVGRCGIGSNSVLTLDTNPCNSFCANPIPALSTGCKRPARIPCWRSCSPRAG